ncbi:hypothetical protein K438DRAFT_1804841 [Mycena galopus ATCC 62051]|nr:hypothetical protein K438DRAFT_1804841 [Mycena galopus ATCC 62051]
MKSSAPVYGARTESPTTPGPPTLHSLEERLTPARTSPTTNTGVGPAARNEMTDDRKPHIRKLDIRRPSGHAHAPAARWSPSIDARNPGPLHALGHKSSAAAHSKQR